MSTPGAAALLALVAPSLVAPSQGPTPLTTTLVASGLITPVHVTAPPGDLERLFVVEQVTGWIRIVKDSTTLPVPFLDIGSLITTSGEQGFLGLAFHPKYATNGQFFVCYNDLAGAVTVAR